LAHDRLGRWELALRDFRTLAEVEPHEPWWVVNQGLLLFKLGQYGEAVEAFDKAVVLDPDHAQAYAIRGAAHEKLGEHERARDDYERAIELDDAGRPGVHLRLALVLWGHFDDLAGAEKHLRRAADLDPENVSPWIILGNVLNLQRKYAEAIEPFAKATALADLPAEVRRWYGGALHEVGRYDDALDQFDAGLALDGEDAQLHHNRGNALSRLGRYEEAEEAYARAIELDPEKAYWWNGRGMVRLHHLAKPEDALLDFQQACARDNHSAVLHHNRGNALWGLGRREEAENAYARAIELDPEMPNAHVNRAVALHALDDYESAYQELEEAIRCGRTRPTNWDVLGPQLHQVAHSLLTNGSDERAFHAFRRIIELEPRRGRFFAILGCACEGDPRADSPRTASARAVLREHARTWLGELLDIAESWMRDFPDESADIGRTLRDELQCQPELAAIRDPERLAELPGSEAEAWRSFWRRVDRLLDRARATASAAPSEDVDPRIFELRSELARISWLDAGPRAWTYRQMNWRYRQLEEWGASNAMLDRVLASHWLGDAAARAMAETVRSWNFLALGHPEQALAATRSAIRIDRAAGPADLAGRLRAEARALIALDRFDEAEEVARRALETEPGAGPNHALLAEILHARGRTEEALRILRPAIHLAPEGPRLHEQLVAVLAELGDEDGVREENERWSRIESAR
jgi:tetratricopeptide (TPR) repeat protein